jgi:hypothetical protein
VRCRDQAKLSLLMQLSQSASLSSLEYANPTLVQWMGSGKAPKFAVGFWPTFTAAGATLNGACDDAFGRRRDTAGVLAL